MLKEKLIEIKNNVDPKMVYSGLTVIVLGGVVVAGVSHVLSKVGLPKFAAAVKG